MIMQEQEYRGRDGRYHALTLTEGRCGLYDEVGVYNVHQHVWDRGNVTTHLIGGGSARRSARRLYDKQARKLAKHCEAVTDETR